MASFRRTMSLVTRDGIKGEAFSVSSPSPKSSHPQNYSVSIGRLATFFGLVYLFELLSRIREFTLGICTQRTRTSDRSKSKGQAWKRAFFHFFLCFMVGLFIGLTPFISVNLSPNIVSKYQTFSFETSPPNGSTSPNSDTNTKRSSLLEKFNIAPEMDTDLREGELGDFLAPSTVTDSDFGDRKLLIVVTPTYNRAFQAFYLNRLAHTLRLVPPPLLWIVVEMFVQSIETDEILRRTGVMYRHLVCEKNLTSTKDAGVHQRNAALAHIEKHHLDGIVYFADDDNVYTIELFEKMRQIRRFGAWPVAMLMKSKNKAIIEGPVCNGSQVIGWHTIERSKRTRRFHVDLSGFAFNSTILWDPKGWHRPTPESIRQLDTVKEGLQETTFAEQVVEDESQMEGLPNECSRIMVWRVYLEAPQLAYPRSWFTQKNLDVIAPL